MQPLLVAADVSEKPVGPIFKGQRLFDPRPTGCPETSVPECQSVLRNFPEERRPRATVHQNIGEAFFG